MTRTDAPAHADQRLEHLHGHGGSDDLHLHRHDFGDERPISHPLRGADHQRAVSGHRRGRSDGDLHPRVGQLASQSCSATTNASGAASCAIADVNQTSGTVGVSATYGGNTYYQSSTAAVDGDGPHSDHADGQRGNQRLRRRRHRLCGADQLHHGGGASRVKSVTTHVERHASRAPRTTNASGVASCSITPNEPAGDVLAQCVVRRRHGQGAAAAVELRHEQLRGDPRGDGDHLHRPLHRRERDVVHHDGEPDDRWQPTGRPGGPHDPRVAGARPRAAPAPPTPPAIASCTIATVNQTAGSVPITVSFAGDAYYRPASASGTETTAAPPAGGGGFVVGDVSAGAPTAGTTGELLGLADLEDQPVQRRQQCSGIHEGLYRQRAELHLRRQRGRRTRATAPTRRRPSR